MKFTGEYCIPGVSPKRIEDDHVQRYRFAAQFVRGRRVLDIACGTGYGASLLGNAGATHVDGVDISDDVLAYAKSHYTTSSIHFSMGDIATFHSPTPYDVITCFETIEHVREADRVLANLHSLLKEGGTLLISSPNRPITSPLAKSAHDKPKNPHHVREFTIAELRYPLEKMGFKIEGVYGQRHRRHFKNPLMRKIQKRIFKPDDRSSPAVTPVQNREPRYFLLVARKTA